MSARSEEDQVVVAGAGLGGLVAALELGRRGVSTLLIEAQSEVGGRTKTDLARGHIEERGAEFYHPEHHVMVVAALRRFGIHSMQMPAWSEHTMMADPLGQPRMVSADVLKQSRLRVSVDKDASAQRLDVWWHPEAAQFDIPWLDYVSQLPGSSLEHSHLMAWLHTLTGSVASAHSALGVLREIAQFGGLERVLDAVECRIEGGISRLVRALFAEVQSHDCVDIWFESSVASVKQIKAGYQINIVDGRKVNAKALIMALPMNVATRLNWHASLPELVRGSLAALGPHANQSVKHWFNVGAPFNDRISGETSAIAFTEAKGEAGCVIAPATHRLLDEAGALGLSAVPMDPSRCHNWSQDPFALGAWMTPRVGQIERLHELICWSEAHPELQWVGGDWSPVWAGWMEGAFHSGEAAVHSLIDHGLTG